VKRVVKGRLNIILQVRVDCAKEKTQEDKQEKTNKKNSLAHGLTPYIDVAVVIRFSLLRKQSVIVGTMVIEKVDLFLHRGMSHWPKKPIYWM
jgi:hypothetical protein